MTDLTVLPVKKQFLQRAFFPLGSEVCNAIGLVPSSEDVVELEQHHAYHELLAATHDFDKFVSARIHWYMQGLEALQSTGLPVEERSLEDHLKAFATSVMVDERWTM